MLDKYQSNNMNPLIKKNSKGFTLIEMIVSLGLFTIVLFVATSAFLSIVNVDRKSRATRIVADNLNLSIEDMTRNIKTGLTYYCGTPDTGSVGDCALGANSMFFTNQEGVRIGYYLDNVTTHAIFRTTGTGPGAVTQRVTSPEIVIENLKFFVSGSTSYLSGDRKQPMVVIMISGSLGANMPIKIQTTVTQRAYDN